MSDVSENRYRASFLAWPARIAAWPLAALMALGSLLVRAIVYPLAAGNEDLQRASDPGAYAKAAGSYLGFQTPAPPPLWGPVPAPGAPLGPWQQASRRLQKSHVAMASMVLFLLYVYVGIAAQAGWIASGYAATRRGMEHLEPGTEYAKSQDNEPARKLASSEVPTLGTDFQGRDVLSLTLRGTTTALWIGLFAATLSCFIGVLLGAVAGFFGGWVDDLVVWLYTTISSIPYLLLLLAFAYVFRQQPELKDWFNASFFRTSLDLSLGLFQIIIAVGLTSWVGICRVVRGEIIKLRELEYVTAGRSLGLPTSRLLFKHVLPNAFHLVLVSFSLLFISAIKFEVVLSFLGLGLEPEEASWGAMIRQGAQELIRTPSVWWQITAATVAMFGLVLAVNLLADAMRDALDPRLKT
ncbi:MAG: ABC transporter permease [Planctomycetota bacterium]